MRLDHAGTITTATPRLTLSDPGSTTPPLTVAVDATGVFNAYVERHDDGDVVAVVVLIDERRSVVGGTLDVQSWLDRP